MIQGTLRALTAVWHQQTAIISQILRIPSICILCQEYQSEKGPVCLPCQSLFAKLGPHCRCCAMPLPSGNFLLCGSCIKQKPAFDHVISSYQFDEPLRTILHEYKYHSGLYLTNFIRDRMLEAVNEAILQSDCLVPVPLHSSRLSKRGFNQAAELAKALAKSLNIALDLELCQKIHNTSSQAGLSKEQRQKNLRGAFRINAHHYERITVVDDLLTTGSTAHELAKTLKKQGAKQVNIWCCARATLDVIRRN